MIFKKKFLVISYKYLIINNTDLFRSSYNLRLYVCKSKFFFHLASFTVPYAH